MNNEMEKNIVSISLNSIRGNKLSDKINENFEKKDEKLIFENLNAKDFSESLLLEEGTDEYAQAMDFFYLLDKNSDGILESDELSDSDDGQIDTISELQNQITKYNEMIKDVDNIKIEDIINASNARLDENSAFEILNDYIDNPEDFVFNEEGQYFVNTDNSEYLKILTKNDDYIVAHTKIQRDNPPIREILAKETNEEKEITPAALAEEFAQLTELNLVTENEETKKQVDEILNQVLEMSDEEFLEFFEANGSQLLANSSYDMDLVQNFNSRYIQMTLQFNENEDKETLSNKIGSAMDVFSKKSFVNQETLDFACDYIAHALKSENLSDEQFYEYRDKIKDQYFSDLPLYNKLRLMNARILAADISALNQLSNVLPGITRALSSTTDSSELTDLQYECIEYVINSNFTDNDTEKELVDALAKSGHVDVIKKCINSILENSKNSHTITGGSIRYFTQYIMSRIPLYEDRLKLEKTVVNALESSFGLNEDFNTDIEISKKDTLIKSLEQYGYSIIENGNQIRVQGKNEYPINNDRKFTINTSNFISGNYNLTKEGNNITITNKDTNKVTTLDLNKMTNGLSPIDAAIFKETLLQLPADVLADIATEDKFVFTNTSDLTYRANYTLMFNTINIDTNRLNSVEAIVHETGHALDERYNNFQSDNFTFSNTFYSERNKYAQEGNKVHSETGNNLQNMSVTSEGPYNTWNSAEMFAECYTLLTTGKCADFNSIQTILEYFPETLNEAINLINSTRAGR